MILSCPNCATCYTLNEAQLGPRGRTVRCAACKTTWHAQAPEEPIDLSYSDPKKKTVEDLKSVKAEKLPSKYRALLEDKKRLKALTAQGILWGGLAAAFVLILAIGFALRVDIVRAFPRIAGAYAMVGLKVNGTNLAFGDYTADANFKGGRFVVTVKAQIKNMSDQPTPVPPVRVKLRDATLQQFDSVLIPSNGLVVAPHATRTLVFDVGDARNMTSTLDLDFDLEAMKAMGKGHAAGHVAVAEAEPVQSAPSPTQGAAAMTPNDEASEEPADMDSPDANGAAVSNKPMPALRPATATGIADEVANGDHKLSHKSDNNGRS